VLQVSGQRYNASINIVSEILQKNPKLFKHFLKSGTIFLIRDRAYKEKIEDRCKKVISGCRM
jgi:hypothetical protein